jgi:mRNA interferase MazF
LVSRGAIFDLELEVEGRRPVCILTRDEAIPVLSNVVVALITRTIREIPSEVVIGPEDGMKAVCAISLDNLRTVPKALLTNEVARLGPAKMDAVCRALGAASGCG